MGILKLIFILTILLFPLGEITKFNISKGLSITVNDIAITILGTTWFIIYLIKKKKNQTLLKKPILIFVAICLLSLLININNFSFNELTTSSLYLVRWIMYASLYFITKNFDSNFKKKITYLLLAIGGIFVFLGYLQYFLYNDLHNLLYLGWDDHMYRLFSSFLDPNFTGTFLVLFLFLVIIMFINALNNKSKIKSIMILFLIVITFIAVILTYSRGALIMLFAGSISLFMLTKNTKWLLLLLGLFMIVFAFLSRYFYIENVNLFRTVSTKARITSVLDALRIIRDHPIFGVGFNTYRYTQIKYGFRHGIGGEISHADAGTDNSFLFVFATTGIIGLVAFLNILRLIILKSIFNIHYRNKYKLTSILVLSSIIGIAVNSLFINSFFFPFIMEWMWILLGLTENT